MTNPVGVPRRLSEATLGPLSPWESYIDTQIERLGQKLVEMRRYLHAHPEPSGEEIETTRYVAERLRENGLEARICRNQIGVVADLTIGNPSPAAPRIAIRADMDALRLHDEKVVAYASQNPGVAHACGHDAHTAIVLGTAIAGCQLHRELTDRPREFSARLRFIFQPAEETSEGANWLVDQGVLDGVDAIIALHVDPERPVGQIGLRYGVLTAHCDEVDILIDGHGGHAARPHHSNDPVAAAAQLITALYQSLPRSVDSRNPTVFTIGKVAGGYAPNVIPECVELRGSLRTSDSQSRQILKSRIEKIASGIADICCVDVRVKFINPLKAVNNHPQVTAALEEASRRVVGAENIDFIDQPSMGGEDFGVYLDHVPGAMFRLGCGRSAIEPSPFLHSPKFDIGEGALTVGARILTRAVVLLSAEFQTAAGETSGDDSV